jgi:AraC-like DNA-binding protein
VLAACADPSSAPGPARLAALADMTLATLRRRFREATGLPIHAYLISRRIAAARELLERSDLAIKAVAERLGYSDVFFFSRQFRRHVGIAPAAFRRTRQAVGTVSPT